MDLVISGQVMGTPAVSSKVVAERFNKRHDDVLKAIRLLREDVEDAVFWCRHFADVEITGKLSGAARKKEIVMTRDGFALLAMGFTGRQAVKHKIDFINAFNALSEIAMNSAADAAWWRNESDRLSKLVPKTKAIDAPKRSNRFQCPFIMWTLNNQVEIVWQKAKKEDVEEWQWAMAMARHAAAIKSALIARCNKIIKDCVRVVVDKFKPSELATERDAVMSQVFSLLSQRVLIA